METNQLFVHILASNMPFRRNIVEQLRAVYVEAREDGHWDNKRHVETMTRLLNESRGKSYDRKHERVVVAGAVAHSSTGPCQFLVGLQGLHMPAPWSHPTVGVHQKFLGPSR